MYGDRVDILLPWLTQLARSRYSFVNMDGLPVDEAARRLGVVPQRVRAMARAGRLPARKVGRAWVIDPQPSGWKRRGPGRPLAAANAWALLAILEGSSPDWVDPAVRSRLKRRALDRGWLLSALRNGEARSIVFHWRLLEPDLDRIGNQFRVVLSGLASLEKLDLVPARREFDAYVSDEALIAMRDRFHPLESSEAPNVILRVPSNPWILERSEAPPQVVAADLLDHPDPRARRAAEEFLSGESR